MHNDLTMVHLLPENHSLKLFVFKLHFVLTVDWHYMWVQHPFLNCGLFGHPISDTHQTAKTQWKRDWKRKQTGKASNGLHYL